MMPEYCTNPIHLSQEMTKLEKPTGEDTWESVFNIPISMDYDDVYRCPIVEPEECGHVTARAPGG